MAAQITYIDAIKNALQDEMRKDETVFCLGEDIGVYGGAFRVTKGFLEEFGRDRILDTPIAESAIIGAAMGAAINGMRPVAEMQFADFITSGFNQVVNNAAKAHYRWGAKVPMVVRCPCGGGVSGGPFHSQNVEAWFVRVPGLKVVMPSFPRDAYGLMKAAIRDNNPVLYFENKFLYRRIKEVLPEGDFVTEIGKGVIRKPGTDVSVITYGATVHSSLEVAAELEKEGHSVEIVDMISLLPYDKDIMLSSVKKTGKVLVLHEDTLTGGVGGEFAGVIAEEAFEYLDAPVKRLGALDSPVPYSPTLEKAFLPGKDKIEAELRTLLAY